MYLLDTHVLLWAASAPETLTRSALAILEDASARLYLSAASAHELAIKWRLGKLALPSPPPEFVATRLARHRIQELAITARHATHVASLPDHHGDPFDRLIVAQAQLEGLTILTRDGQIPRYDVRVIAA